MRRGPPTPGIHQARIFFLFPLLGGRPWRFVPGLDPAAAEELEGSMGSGARRKKRHWRKEVKCQKSQGNPI
jgi:hypothetical protein